MTEKAVVVNYTAEQTAEVVTRYQAGETVEAIALAVGHSVRSVIAKLSREKVYVAKQKTPVARVTKAVLIAAIAAKVGASEEALESLEKATASALALVLDGL